MELELARSNNTGSNGSLNGSNATRQRRHYASLDPTSMGVDVPVVMNNIISNNIPDFENNR